MIRALDFDALYTGSHWVNGARVELDAKGNIVGIAARRDANDLRPARGICIPGIVNAHSHAFQYAMAGMSECFTLGQKQDNFWSWREAMYRLALTINPDQCREIATSLYAELLENGFTSVVEFHYLQHDVNGMPYSQAYAMSDAIIDAAAETGIRLCLVPVFYKWADFAAKPSLPEQRRFVFPGVDAFLKFCDELVPRATSQGATCGIGVHSLRAATGEDAAQIWRTNRTPRHIHIAEQAKEVDACMKIHGCSPQAYLARHCTIDASVNLVHNTHCNAHDLHLTQHGNLVICPSTEANLGDGIFPLVEWLDQGGSVAIGTDSHICTNPFEELRWMDYGQRLTRRQRNPLATEQESESGARILNAVYRGGQRAMGLTDGDALRVGAPFDAVVLDTNEPRLGAASQEKIFSHLIFAENRKHHRETYVSGKKVAEHRTHIKADEIRRRYARCLAGLRKI